MYLSTFFNVFIKMININKLNVAYSWISYSDSCSSTLNYICLNFEINLSIFFNVFV